MVQPTCATSGKNQFEKGISGTTGCFGSGKDDKKVMNCHTFADRGREPKQVPLNSPDGGAPKRNHLYDLQDKRANSGDDECKF